MDANGSDNAVRFENIRVNDTANRTYLETVNKYVKYSKTYGELPVPVKPGQEFLGWVDAKGNPVTAETLMESASTVYLTSTWTTDTNSVSDDTIIIEYGLPVKIDIGANDKSTAAVTSIGVVQIDDANLGHTGHPNSKFATATTSVELANGNAVLNADGTITYTPTNTNAVDEDVFYYEVQIDGKYYYAKVTVIPATSIYYEDTFFNYIDKGDYKWQVVGDKKATAAFQGVDRPGAFNFTDDLNNAYGFDSAYDGDVAYSDGTAHFVEVDKAAGANGPTAVFTFTGTGFDLFSANDSLSGTVTVTIYRGTEVGKNRVKGIMSNAYFGYSYDEATGEYIAGDNGKIYQVPVIAEHDMEYGTYTVVVMPRYNQSFDELNRGKAGTYVDSVRIYDPMGSDDEIINQAYRTDGEYAPRYINVRDTIVKPNGNGTFEITDLGENTAVFLDGGRNSLEDFAKLGPKNEVYLGKGNSIAFHITTDRAGLPATIQLGMKLTGKGGNSANVKVYNSNYKSWDEDFVLNSATDRFYNIEGAVDWVKQADGTYKTATPVIITNTSDAVISITSIKYAFASEDTSATVLSLITDEQTPVLAMAAINRMLNPDAQNDPQQTILSKDNISVAFSGEPYSKGDSGMLTITTEQGVAGVTVNGNDVVDCETDENGKLVWTYEFTADTAGTVTYEVLVYDENGTTSEAIYAITDVEGDEPVQPDDDVTEPDNGEDNDGSTGNNTNLSPDSFEQNILKGIMSIFAKLFELLFGGVAE